MMKKNQFVPFIFIINNHIFKMIVYDIEFHNHPNIKINFYQNLDNYENFNDFCNSVKQLYDYEKNIFIIVDAKNLKNIRFISFLKLYFFHDKREKKLNYKIINCESWYVRTALNYIFHTN